MESVQQNDGRIFRQTREEEEMKKENEPEYKCPLDPNLSEEENKALRWLSDVLTDLANSPSPSARTASVAHVAMGKLFTKLSELHELAHDQEEELIAAEELDKIISSYTGEKLPEELN
jgi:hypothetical protein